MRDPEAASVRNQAIAAVVVSSLFTLACCLVAFPAIITSAIAISRVDSDLASARRLVRASWWIIAGAVALGVLGLVIWIAVVGAHHSS
jgi:NADH:ubiquinone oxidoreductase subunit B-like Fe-S oxidoreductase